MGGVTFKSFTFTVWRRGKWDILPDDEARETESDVSISFYLYLSN
jgi:hypothetical protein